MVEERQRGGDLPEENGCDPWTAGESDPTGNPRDPSLVPNRPGQPFRRGSLEQNGYSERK